MEWNEVLKFVVASIVSIGSGGAIVFALSSWLGKVWASRILEKEKFDMSTELEKTKRELDLLKETTLKFQNDKILIYRAAIDVVARLLASFDSHQFGRLSAQEAGSRFDEFNEQRIRMYGYLAMLAPQQVMDAQDRLVDYLLVVASGSEAYVWSKVRELGLDLINSIRADVGIDKAPISYNGAL